MILHEGKVSRGGNKQGMGNDAVREVVEGMSTRVVYTIRGGGREGKGAHGQSNRMVGETV